MRFNRYDWWALFFVGFVGLFGRFFLGTFGTLFVVVFVPYVVCSFFAEYERFLSRRQAPPSASPVEPSWMK